MTQKGKRVDTIQIFTTKANSCLVGLSAADRISLLLPPHGGFGLKPAHSQPVEPRENEPEAHGPHQQSCHSAAPQAAASRQSDHDQWL